MASPNHIQEYPTAAERTAKAAHEARMKAMSAARGFLGRNATRLSVARGFTAQDIIDSEGNHAASEVEKLRSRQTVQSLGLGVTLYITPAATIRLQAFADTKEGHTFAPYADEIRMADAKGVHHRLYLPNGIFNASFGGVQTYGQATWEKGKGSASDPYDPMGLAYAEVVRIEGDNNEVWQNMHFSPDGSPLRRA